jgi:hypothetical protein
MAGTRQMRLIAHLLWEEDPTLFAQEPIVKNTVG